MKMKKITALIVSAVALIASFSAFPAVNVKANAEEAKVQLVHAYDEYNNSFITEKFEDAYGITFDSEKEYFFEYKSASAEEWGKAVDADSGKTTFEIAPGDALIRFYSEVAGEEGAEATKEYVNVGGVEEFAFEVISETEEGSIYYNLPSDKVWYENYNASIKSKHEGKTIGDNFYYPTLEDVVIVNDNAESKDVNEEVKANLIVSDHYDYSDLTKEIWYCRPGNSSFSKTTSSSFNLNAVGSYSYYVIAYDASKTYLATDISDNYTRKVVDGIEGWYDDADKLIVPIFSFYFSNVKNVAITIEKSERGFKGLTYKDVDDAITIVGENEGTKYELYYSATLLAGSDGSDKEWTSKGVDVIESSSNVKNITEEEAYEFDASTRYFIPQELGYYYVVCHAADQTGEDTAVTYAIAVNKEFSLVKYESQFFKQNLFSIICLGVAFVLLIAIIVVFFFYKPAEKKSEESVDPVSKK